MWEMRLLMLPRLESASLSNSPTVCKMCMHIIIFLPYEELYFFLDQNWRKVQCYSFFHMAFYWPLVFTTCIYHCSWPTLNGGKDSPVIPALSFLRKSPITKYYCWKIDRVCLWRFPPNGKWQENHHGKLFIHFIFLFCLRNPRWSGYSCGFSWESCSGYRKRIWKSRKSDR